VPQVLALLLCLLSVGCTYRPESYPPPEQHKPLTIPPPTPFGHFVAMDDPNVDAYLVKDIADRGPGPWRWAYSHPVLRFFVPAAPRLRFAMDFTLPERTFRETGPVTLTFRINGELLERYRCDTPGEQHYSHSVPPGMVHPDAVNLVAIDPNPVWVSKADGGRLGFILSRAGFTE
jgi:hypothetical protein